MSALDAPVSGGDIGAREARLAIMAGGDREAFEKVLPLFRLMGKTISYMGGPGSGQCTKLANQITIASTMIGVVEALQFACRAGSWPCNFTGPLPAWIWRIRAHRPSTRSSSA